MAKEPSEKRPAGAETGCHQDITLSRGRVRYSLFGPEVGPLIVCIHGFGVFSWVYFALARLLAKAGFRVLTFDLWGWGGSAAPKTTYGLELYLEQIRELIPALGLPRPFVLVGHSMGGWIATHYQSRYPQDVSALVLIAPAGLRVSTPFFNGWYSALIQAGYKLCSISILQPLLSTVLRVFMTLLRITAGPPMSPETLCAATALLEPFRRSPREQYSKMMSISLESWRLAASMPGSRALSLAMRSVLVNVPFFCDKRMPVVLEATGRAGRPPVLLVWGKRDSFLPFANAGAILRIMGPTRVRFLGFCDADHFPFFDYPREVARAIGALAAEAGAAPLHMARPTSCPCLCLRPATPAKVPSETPPPPPRPASAAPGLPGTSRDREAAAPPDADLDALLADSAPATPAPEPEREEERGYPGCCPAALADTLAEVDLASVEGYGHATTRSPLAAALAQAAPVAAAAAGAAAGAAILYRRRRDIARILSFFFFA